MSTSPPLAASPPAGDGSWRPRLLASLRDCGVQRSPRSGAVYWVLAIALIVVLAVVSFIGEQMLKNLRTEGDRIVGWIIRVVWLLFCIFFLYRLRNWLLRQAWQGSAASAEDELERPDARRPILYLRSFQLDDRINQRTWSERFLGAYPSETAEQAMTKALRSAGPAIAIGRPDEQLPPLGAARFYVSHDRWQQKVKDVAAEAQFVVWATGTTEGLRWEISHLVATVPPENVIVWAHSQLLRLSPREREAEWARFRAALGDVFPMPLPEELGEARFIYFTEGWVPHPVAPPRRPVPWLEPTRAALRGVLAVKTGVDAISSPRQWVARLGGVGLGVVVGAILAAVLALILPDFTETDKGGNRTVYHKTSDGSGFLLFVNVALAGLALTLGLGRSALWRRVRLIGAALLAVLALLTAIANLVEYSRVRNYSSFIMEPAYGVYVKLGMASVVAALAVGLLIARWRWTEAAAPRRPVTASDVDYAGPGDDTFAELVGAAGPAVVWPRVAGFFAALAAMRLLPPLLVSQWFSVYGLVWAALVTAAAVAAFRFLRAGAAPVVAAAAVAILWAVVGGRETGMADLGRTLVATLGLLAGLSWAVRRMGPRPFALWFGAMWEPLAVWLAQLFAGGDAAAGGRQDVLSVLLGPVVFAAAMEVAVRLTSRRR